MPAIRQQVLITSPSSVVFKALTTQQGLAAWWTPDAQAQPIINSVARFPFGAGYCKEMKITQLAPPSLVEWFCIAGADEWVGTPLSFSLHSGTGEQLQQSNPEMQDQIQQSSSFEQATIISLHHNNWKDYTPMFAECTYTWEQFLRSLKAYYQTGNGYPWPNQHRALS